MNRIAKDFLDLLRKEGLDGQLAEIVEDLSRELTRSQAITVITASKLSTKERKELEASLTEKWGEHDVRVTVDSSLLSGLIIRFGHQVIDRSGRAAVSDLSATLSQ